MSDRTFGNDAFDVRILANIETYLLHMLLFFIGVRRFRPVGHRGVALKRVVVAQCAEIPVDQSPHGYVGAPVNLVPSGLASQRVPPTDFPNFVVR